MCGWNNLKELISQLEERKEYERAACICVFNKNLEKAIELLTTASKTSKIRLKICCNLILIFYYYNKRQSERIFGLVISLKFYSQQSK